MNYFEAREYLREVNKYGSVLGLESIKELLKRLGNPHLELKVVHIAGTNGKGSTLSFLQSIIMESGYRVGRYSSPAVFEYREIIRVNNDYIDEFSLANIISTIKEKCDDMVNEGLSHPTPFEIETAMAFVYFKQKMCDIVLIECGLGGETDATNVFEKVLCSVITTISLDHTQFLGTTIDEISKVKAGIIKKGCPVIMSNQSNEAIEAVGLMAKQKESELIVTNCVYKFKPNEYITNFKYVASNNEIYYADLKMLGTYQAINAATAVETALVLEKLGFNVKSNIESGLERAFWPGRLEIICKDPFIIIDGAHNPGAVGELRKSIDLYFTNKRITFIMGVLADKDFSQEAEIIADKAVNIITITPNNARALDGIKLAETLKVYNKNVEVSDTLEEAVLVAKESIKNNQTDMILAFGSLSFLSDFKNIVNK